MTVDSEIAQDCLLKSTLIGPGHTSVFREGSNRKFENQKGGCPLPSVLADAHRRCSRDHLHDDVAHVVAALAPPAVRDLIFGVPLDASQPHVAVGAALAMRRGDDDPTHDAVNLLLVRLATIWRRQIIPLAQPLGGGRFLPPHNPIDAAAN
jgi:hypothetical protein